MSIDLNNVLKIYNKSGNKTIALRGIDLSIKDGEKIIIVGESGAGKSTLLNIIGLIDRQFSGDYLLDGKNILDFNTNEICKLLNQTFGFIFQEYALIEEETVFNNVKIPLVYSSVRKKYYRKKVEDMLKSVELNNVIDKKVNELSGGQRQRVAIARALINNPSIILADEPTGSLDKRMTKQVIDIIYSCLDESKILILVTHDLKRIQITDEKIITLEDGFIIN